MINIVTLALTSLATFEDTGALIIIPDINSVNYMCASYLKINVCWAVWGIKLGGHFDHCSSTNTASGSLIRDKAVHTRLICKNQK